MKVSTRVVIVDDSWQFVLHAWRIISGTLGFGLGRRSPKDFEAGQFLLDYTPEDAAPGNGESTHTKEGVCPSGLCSVCWIHPKGEAELAAFARVHDEARVHDQRVISLIDVDLGSKLPPDTFEAYVRAHIEAQERRKIANPTEDLVVVSSYRCDAPLISGHMIFVEAKTAETLTRRVTAPIRSSTKRPTGGTTPTEDRDLQILVTGAGFELGDTIGLPDTGKIIESLKLGLPHGKELLFLGRDDYRFPVPVDPIGAISKELEKHARTGNLDAYWNVILRSFRRSGDTSPNERGSQPPGFILELRMRELFRRAIERYDVGHMRQALIAASQPWDVWLTTNYTRFANRAIRYEDDRGTFQNGSPEEPAKDESGADARARAWETISNAEEASLLHRVMRDEQGRSRRYLIKLHGDISQVYTMAIAGEDKEPFSDLLIQPPIYPIYAAALEFVCLSSKPARGCVWHVVGHSLYDRALTRIFQLAVERSDGRHHFVLAGPDAEAVKKRVSRAWKAEWGSAWDRVQVEAVPWKAERYMASLEAAGGVPR